ncbi:hypothetical protein OHA40_14540 [Nocardia sp. NBC_00508]|uniref:hypothetical protein n=1 Tax=Nocardia sp. NBC_00508 TaxID=2975992 RepID=UPI002E820EE6|nr:hypothetical protein [Nocardia sp. NBC_00508]WUD69233.1 hypothetical protein OHA40_14540 [Nocardia sp. NBC_00508]
MADLETTAPILPMDAEFEFATASTPLRRAAGRLRTVLPPGWRVEVVDAPTWLYGDRAPILRVVMPSD